MRWVIAILAICMTATGCRYWKKGRKTAKPESAVVTPVRAYTGSIALVNAELRYVVVEGTVGELPPVGTTLQVFRGDNKVADIVVSEQRQDVNYAADITNGQPQVGDSIRSQVETPPAPEEEK